MTYLNSLPDDATMVDVFRAFSDTSRPLGAFHQATMRGVPGLSDGERELIAALVSALNSCEFCVGIHEAAAVGFGADTGLLQQMMTDIDSASIDDRLKPVMRFVHKLTLTPAKIVRADIDAMTAAGFDDAAIHNIVCVACFYSFMNRYVNGHGINAAPEELRRMGEQLVGAGSVSAD